MELEGGTVAEGLGEDGRPDADAAGTGHGDNCHRLQVGI